MEWPLPPDKRPVVEKEIIDHLVSEDGSGEAVGVAVHIMDTAADRREARKGKHEVQVPLAGLHVGEDDLNFQHVEDYTYWLWEVQDCDDEAEEMPQFPIGTVAFYGPDDESRRLA